MSKVKLKPALPATFKVSAKGSPILAVPKNGVTFDPFCLTYILEQIQWSQHLVSLLQLAWPLEVGRQVCPWGRHLPPRPRGLGGAPPSSCLLCGHPLTF